MGLARISHDRQIVFAHSGPKNEHFTNSLNDCPVSMATLQIEQGEKGLQRVNIAGDGAKISRISNYIVLSVALLSDDRSVMSRKGKTLV